jgi:hypothetical protein
MTNALPRCVHCGAQLSRSNLAVCAVCGKSQSEPPVHGGAAPSAASPPTAAEVRPGPSTRRLTEFLNKDGSPVAAEPQGPTLLVREGGAVHTYLLGDEPLSFGRAPTNDIVCPARVVSSRHARFDPVGDGHTITDVGSTNGLILGGLRLPVNMPHELLHGDELQIGDAASGNIVTLGYHNPLAQAPTQFIAAAEHTVTVRTDAPAAAPSRNPYTVGSPTRGVHFYGRRDIAASLIDSNDHALWLIGNRRMGKTSLMRFIEEQVDARPDSVAFYINLEASENFEDLSACFFDDLEIAEARLAELGLSAEQLRGRDAAEIVRLLNRSGRAQNKQVLLLWDEAEALIRIGEASNSALRRLHREVQRAEALRLVITATKRLEVLNDLCRSWETSAFLYSFKLRYLGPLSLEEVGALVSQRQQGGPVQANPTFVRRIYDATGGHPYLTQWLCDRLYSEGRLRPLADDDLVPSSALASLFQTDYNHLSPSERRILRAFVNVEEASEEALARHLDGALSSTELRYVLQSLQALCYLRRGEGGYRTGSRLLLNWLRLGYIDETEMPVSDAATIEMSDEERQHVQRMITINRRNLYTLQERAAQYGLNPPLELTNEIRQQEESIAALERQLQELRGE